MKELRKGGEKMKEANATILYGWLSRKLASEGLTQEEFEQIKNMPIGHHSVWDLIEANFKAGYLVEREGRIFNANHHLTLKFTKDEGKILENEAQKYGLEPAEFANQILAQALRTISS
ncbi:MAG: hypothetical protein P8Y17_01660 [Patescibacteria group bacterium]